MREEGWFGWLLEMLPEGWEAKAKDPPLG